VDHEHRVDVAVAVQVELAEVDRGVDLPDVLLGELAAGREHVVTVVVAE